MTCTKCGNVSAGLNPMYHKKCKLDSDEHLHYMCSRCGYNWTADTLDKRQNSDRQCALRRAINENRN